MHHDDTIFAKIRAGLSEQYRTLAEVWCQSATITFYNTTNVYVN